MGHTTGDGVDIEQQLNMKRMDRIEDEIAQLERDKIKMETGGDNKDEKFVAKRLEILGKRKSELTKEIQNPSISKPAAKKSSNCSKSLTT